ncbi:UbiA family prenyltransferase [Sphaerisporangium sp. NPDC049002]|uniref:UbiA family prenyltransferase n=1 Tax=unclassified Sphaerisporangium TaxID=2630420 RepID=UPI0033DDD343
MTSIWATRQATGASALRSGIRVLGLCVVEARPAVLSISTLRYLAGAALAVPAGAMPDPAKVLQGAVAWVLSILAIYLYNGVTDVTEDRVNHSRRPIARGDLDPRTAVAVALVAAGLSLGVTLALPVQVTWMVGANLLLGYLYSGPPFPLKSGSGGTIIVLCVSGLLSYWCGFFISTGGESVSTPLELIVFAIAATYWMTLVGVPAKDLSDIDGDAAAGRRTIGVTLGERTSRCVMSVAAAVLVAAFGVTILVLGIPLIGAFVAMSAGAAAVIMAGRAASVKGSRRRQRRPYRVFMATQHLVHITALISNMSSYMLL